MESNLKYQIALTSVWWNDDYKDVRRFSSALEQEKYFNLENIFNDAPKVNFEIKDLMRPRIVFKESNKDVFDVLNSNYLIVKDNHASSVQKYFFYFATIRQDSGDLYIAECKLDVWQTFGFNSEVNIGEGIIERAHLNRWKTASDKIGFDFSENSPLLIEEKTPEDNNKLLKNRHKLNIYYGNNLVDICQWCSENISGWVYVFIEAYKTYSGLKFEDQAIPESADANFYAAGAESKGIYFPYSIIVFPVYKNNNRIIFRDNNNHNVQLDSNFNLFRNYNSGYSFVYSQKILPVNPLYKILYLAYDSNNAFLEGNDLIIKNSVHSYDYYLDKGYITDQDKEFSLIASNVFNSKYHGVLFFGTNIFEDNNLELLQKQTLKSSDDILITSKPFAETKAQLKKGFNNKTLKRDIKFNPKLYGASYIQFRLNIANQGAESFSYAQLAIDATAVPPKTSNRYIARAAIVPEVETLGLSPRKSMLFDFEDYNSVFGTIITTDLSIAFKNNVYESYLANNKNFWLQNKTKWEAKAFDTLRGSFDGEKLNVAPLIKTGIDIGVEYFQTKYNINNMQNAPALYTSGSGSVSYVLAYEIDISYYLDEYISPEYILKRDDDFMYLYGYKYGKIDSFANVVNIRAYFNYVQGDFPSISGKISDEARRILSNSLNIGVRFWNIDRTEFDFTLENLERTIVED